MQDLADSFRNLDSLRDDLENHRKVHHDVGDFLHDYQSYLQTVARRRAEMIRSRHSQYEDLNRKIAGQTRDAEEAKLEIETTKQSKSDAELAEANAFAEILALNESPFQKDASALKSAKDAAGNCEKQFEQSTQDLVAREADAESNELDCNQRLRDRDQLRGDFTRTLATMREVAESTSFLTEHDQHVPLADQWPHEGEDFIHRKSLFELSVRRRTEAISQLIQLSSKCAAARHRFEAGAPEGGSAVRNRRSATSVLRSESRMPSSSGLARISSRLIKSGQPRLDGYNQMGFDLAEGVDHWIGNGTGRKPRASPYYRARSCQKCFEGQRQREMTIVEQELARS